MLALQPGMDRLSHELSAQRDRLVRLQSVQTDIALDLPTSIPLPDGEEIPYGSATRLQIRDPEQVNLYEMRSLKLILPNASPTSATTPWKFLSYFKFKFFSRG